MKAILPGRYASAPPRLRGERDRSVQVRSRLRDARARRARTPRARRCLRGRLERARGSDTRARRSRRRLRAARQDDPGFRDLDGHRDHARARARVDRLPPRRRSGLALAGGERRHRDRLPRLRRTASDHRAAPADLGGHRRPQRAREPLPAGPRRREGSPLLADDGRAVGLRDALDPVRTHAPRRPRDRSDRGDQPARRRRPLRGERRPSAPGAGVLGGARDRERAHGGVAGRARARAARARAGGRDPAHAAALAAAGSLSGLRREHPGAHRLGRFLRHRAARELAHRLLPGRRGRQGHQRRAADGEDGQPVSLPGEDDREPGGAARDARPRDLRDRDPRHLRHHAGGALRSRARRGDARERRARAGAAARRGRGVHLPAGQRSAARDRRRRRRSPRSGSR